MDKYVYEVNECYTGDDGGYQRSHGLFTTQEKARAALGRVVNILNKSWGDTITFVRKNPDFAVRLYKKSEEEGYIKVLVRPLDKITTDV